MLAPLNERLLRKRTFTQSQKYHPTDDLSFTKYKVSLCNEEFINHYLYQMIKFGTIDSENTGIKSCKK